MQPLELQDLESLFTEKEVWDTVRELPADRAPGPDGFSGAFYQRAWPVIKPDIMSCLLKLGVGDGRGFARLNKALITLIPKNKTRTRSEITGPLALCTVSPNCSPSLLPTD
jgi:hypothetical protein